MSELKATPGPYELTERFDLIANLDTGYQVAVCTFIEGRFCDPPLVALHWDAVRANAHLLAASWEMYQALVAVRSLDDILRESGSRILTEMAREKLDVALAKARGES